MKHALFLGDAPLEAVQTAAAWADLVTVALCGKTKLPINLFAVVEKLNDPERLNSNFLCFGGDNIRLVRLRRKADRFLLPLADYGAIYVCD